MWGRSPVFIVYGNEMKCVTYMDTLITKKDDLISKMPKSDQVIGCREGDRFVPREKRK